MTYASTRRRFAPDGTANKGSATVNGPAAYRAWHSLTPDSRLALIERQLQAMQLVGDGHPAAL